MSNLYFRGVQEDIINYLNNGKKVYIESGCLNDEITGFEQGEKMTDEFWDNGVSFFTSASVFSARISLYSFDSVDCEDVNGCLFVQVH